MPGCAFLLAVSTAVVASFFMSSIFIESEDFIESAGIGEVLVDGDVVDDDVVDGVVAGAGVGVVAGAGIGAGAEAGAGGGVGSFLPQAASATTISEASNSDLFILYEPFMVDLVIGWSSSGEPATSIAAHSIDTEQAGCRLMHSTQPERDHRQVMRGSFPAPAERCDQRLRMRLVIQP